MKIISKKGESQTFILPFIYYKHLHTKHLRNNLKISKFHIRYSVIIVSEGFAERPKGAKASPVVLFFERSFCGACGAVTK